MLTLFSLYLRLNDQILSPLCAMLVCNLGREVADLVERLDWIVDLCEMSNAPHGLKIHGVDLKAHNFICELARVLRLT